jgi:hypothetical protein
MFVSWGLPAISYWSFCGRFYDSVASANVAESRMKLNNNYRVLNRKNCKYFLLVTTQYHGIGQEEL